MNSHLNHIWGFTLISEGYRTRSLKKTLENNLEVEQLTKDRDQIVLELESTRYALEQSKEVLKYLPAGTYFNEIIILKLFIPDHC